MRASCAASALVLASSSEDFAGRHVSHVQVDRVVVHAVLGPVVDPAVRLIVAQRHDVALAQAQRGLPLPGLGEPADPGYGPVPDPLGDQREHAARLDRAELPGVPDRIHPRAGLQGQGHDPRHVGGRGLRGLIDHQASAGPTGTRLAKNRVMFHASLSPSPCMTLAAFSLSVRPMTRPPVMAAQARAKRGHRARFPGSGRGHQAGDEPPAGQHALDGLPLLVVQVRPRPARPRPAASVTSCGTAPSVAFSRIHSSVSMCSEVTNFASPGGR